VGILFQLGILMVYITNLINPLVAKSVAQKVKNKLVINHLFSF